MSVKKILMPLVFLILIGLAAFFVLDALNPAQEPVDDVAGRAEEISFLPTREYNGSLYEARSSNALTTVLLIGYDHKDQGELIPNQDGFIYGGQSDFLLLLVIDHENQRVHQLQFDRDTMTDIKYYNKRGAYYGTRRLQLCLSHAYGDTQEMNNRNTIWAVENLLGIGGEDDGAQIDWYLSMDITGIDRLNDLLGGVTVPIEEDFSYYDPTMVQGTTMTLTGAQAQIYCRQRYHIGKQSNESRMQRQRIYMEAATQKLRELLREDQNYAVKLLNGMGLIYDNTSVQQTETAFSANTQSGTPVSDTPDHYLMTNQSLSAIAAQLMRAMDYEISPLETLPGQHIIGTTGHMEFIMEQDAGVLWMLDKLYVPKDEAPR